MSFEHVAEVFLKIFENKFFEMFFHWSWQVRNMFYFVILFVINYRIRNLNFNDVKQELSGKGIRRNINDKKEVANYPETVN
jgi:hypothetical protein